tara:strand:+ start:6458 stop:7456 length:999 start_codon:yes stop_codon:yes gene_type:complete
MNGEVKRKYPTWGAFLKRVRTQKYRSARELCTHTDVGISYPQYSRYEAGDQLPNLDQALKLCRLLEIPLFEGLMEWCRAQTGTDSAIEEIDQILERFRNDDLTDAQLRGAGGSSDSKSTGVFRRSGPIDRMVIFHSAYRDVFESNPVYRDIFTYLNGFLGEWISLEELAIAFELPTSQIELMTKKLSDLQVIQLENGKCRVAKRVFYFPDDEDFFKLRNTNVSYNVDRILKNLEFEDVSNRLAYRSIVTRPLSRKQVGQLIGKLETLVDSIVSGFDPEPTDEIYSSCFVVGKRFERPSSFRQSSGDLGVNPGLVTDLQATSTKALKEESNKS